MTTIPTTFIPISSIKIPATTQSTSSPRQTTDIQTTAVDSTTALSQSQIRALITKYNTMSSSIDTVTDSINDTTTTRILRSLSCSSYIELVTNFTSIADTLSELENIKSISSEIEDSEVSTCSTTEITSLNTLKSALDTIKSEIEEKIEYYKSLLHSTIVQSTIGKN